MARQYTEDERATVLGELLLGASINSTAKRHDIPRSTIQRWAEMVPRTLPGPLDARDEAEAMRERLGRKVYAFLDTGLDALIAHNLEAARPEFIREHGFVFAERYKALASQVIAIFRGLETGEADTNPDAIVAANEGATPGVDN